MPSPDLNFDYISYIKACQMAKSIVEEFRGPLAMYEKCGFYRQAERENRVVVRKAFK